ncbi:MAG TPA: CvpA family protein [Stellaceae bacterium]|nr:CvpA family protein [Stellaceae bacterium]
MNPLDIGVIAVVALSAVFAFARGFVREALSIVAWAGAAVITYFAFAPTEALIDAHAHNPLLSQVVAGFGLFIGSLVILSILTGIVARLVHFSGLTPIDRTLGFIFGLARGAFIVCLAFLLLDLSMPQQNTWPDWIRDARSKPYLHQGADLLQSFLPQSLKVKSVDDMLAPLSPSQQAMKLMQPPPAAAPAATAAPTYSAHDQKQLDQVIRAQR